jgi:hypothetical protein
VARRKATLGGWTACDIRNTENLGTKKPGSPDTLFDSTLAYTARVLSAVDSDTDIASELHIERGAIFEAKADAQAAAQEYRAAVRQLRRENRNAECAASGPYRDWQAR